MCPRLFRDMITVPRGASKDIESSEGFCQKACGFIHEETRIALCSFCYYPQPESEKALYRYRIHHRLIVEESIGVACHRCGHRLFSARVYYECQIIRRNSSITLQTTLPTVGTITFVIETETL